MSTVNTENLTLYANPYLYNGSRYVFYQTGRDYESWLRQTSLQVDTKVVYYKSLTEDLELNSSVKDVTKYTYGKITNDGKSYYIFIDRITTDQHGKSYISYSVDWWATEWNNIHPTKAHIIRSPNKPQYMSQPFTPLNTMSRLETITEDYCIMATYIPSTEHGTSYISTIVLPGDLANTRMVEQGYWYNILGLPGADIKDCFVVPLFKYSDFIESESLYIVNGEHGGVQGDGFSGDWLKRFVDKPERDDVVYNMHDGKYYICTDSFYDSSTTPPTLYTYWREIDDPTVGKDIIEFIAKKEDDEYYKYKQTNITLEFTNYTKTINEEFYTDEVNQQGIFDWNGNIIWSCPYNITITGFKVTLLRGISHAMLQFVPIYDGLTEYGDMITGKAFCYDCRHPGLFVDSYQDYVLKNREYDIAMRHIQSEKQLWTSAASTVENLGFGYAFGQQKGGIAAGLGGVVETAATYMINSEFDPRIQEQYDKRYALMTDQISLIGDAITNIFIEKPLSKYTLTMDVATQERMNKDIQVNGYVCDETVESLESLFRVGAVIQSDMTVVEGACCLDGKQQTVYRLQNGVEFK